MTKTRCDFCYKSATHTWRYRGYIRGQWRMFHFGTCDDHVRSGEIWAESKKAEPIERKSPAALNDHKADEADRDRRDNRGEWDANDLRPNHD